MAWSRKDEMESRETRWREGELRESRDATWARKTKEEKAGSVEIGAGECGADGATRNHAKGKTNRGDEAGEGAGGSDKGISTTKDDVKKREEAGRILESFSYEALVLFEVMYKSVQMAEAGRAAAKAKAERLQEQLEACEERVEAG